MIHEVVVVGGGVAGAAAAVRLAQHGARLLWITGRAQDGFKPGEHLSAAALPMLKTLNSDAILRSEVHRHAHSTYSAWGSDALIERNAIVQLEGPPTVLDRTAFEQALAQQAETAGVTRVIGDVTDLCIADDTWHITCGGETHTARFIFDATGRKAIVASRFATRFQADKLGCQYALYTAPNGSVPRPVTLIEAEEQGWWYLSTLADGRCVVNFYTDTDLSSFPTDELDKHARTTNAIAAYLDDHGFQPSSRPKRVASNSAWIAPAIGAGWCAVGDASAAFDPLSSHGMTTALWSAITAADAFAAQDRQKMQDYADAVAKGVQDYLSARSAVYGREMRWPHSLFWARRATQTDQTQLPA